MNLHDKFFKDTFSDVTVTKDFLHHYLPEKIQQYVDLETIIPQKDSFIDGKLKESFSDLLFKVNILNEEGYLYFLFEHKSAPDKGIPLQLLKYIVNIWESKVKKQNESTLPIVIPLVLYQGKRNWNAPQRLSEMITALYKTWFPTGQKQLPFPYIVQYLDEEALSWWYQDDGHLTITKGNVTKIVLATDDFSTEENKQLIEVLYEKFKIRFQLDGQNRLLLYDQFQIIYFLHLVAPWLNESMRRKAMPLQPLRPIAKRTTIYLPETIRLTKPTAEINKKLKNLDNLLDPTGKNVCIPTIYKTFTPMLKMKRPTKSYQIVFQEDEREKLAMIRQQTGLSVSLIVSGCFIFYD